MANNSPQNNSIVEGASPSSLIENPIERVPNELQILPLDSPEIKVPSNKSNQSFVPSYQDLELPPALPGQDSKVDTRAKMPILEQELEITQLEDDPECPIFTVRSVLLGLLLQADPPADEIAIYADNIHNHWPKLRVDSWTHLVESRTFQHLYELYFGQVVNFGVALGVLVGSQLLAYGSAGLLQPFLVYPARKVYPETLPCISLFSSLYKVGSQSDDQVKFFKKSFLAIGIYELFPTYILPAFQAISVFCLTLPKNQLVTNIFGGARPFEGVGLLNISLDWSMVGGRGPLFMPPSTQVSSLVLKSLPANALG
ncbi:uncharacterized protein PGTG_02670 [Puccinia graminis f. sp. tritici CRL 75-36-700-3]|uniref:Uncharacterized protein n=1 Tax=Puccinia graminis f. sp. tritici (strain CRL 75-36-700-3 / race SCCL) TaxID=418459 RepID=E3JW04_PUCGT|nr:uncharacterized protein PGTG_02670 [Puccinia graminis f. sp. tritici CRL 75-36-700-3]EFP76229.2 hypothetical protein PGTG_02670 [Puccinia graminis f. sp. tritici CRL 75-36-700-3]